MPWGMGDLRGAGDPRFLWCLCHGGDPCVPWVIWGAGDPTLVIPVRSWCDASDPGEKSLSLWLIPV